METPDALRDAKFTFNEINRKHIGIQLMSSQAKSPTGKLSICATTSFAFSEKRGEEPNVIHEMPDNNLHQMKFTKSVKAGEYTVSRWLEPRSRRLTQPIRIMKRSG